MTLFGIAVSPVHFIALPLFMAFLIPLLAKFAGGLVKYIPGIVLLYLSGVAITLFSHVLETGKPIVEVLAAWKAPMGINLYFDAFSGFLTVVMTIIAFLAWFYSLRFMEEEPLQKFYMLFMLLIAGATGIVLTGDIFNMFVFLEITGISAYSLTAYLRKKGTALASFKYIVMGSLASLFVLLAIAILYAKTGTLNMAEMPLLLENVSIEVKMIVLVFFITGIGIEAEIFPLNGWAPDAYAAAPFNIGAIFAGVVVKGAVYALLRIIFIMFNMPASFELLAVLGLLTLVFAEISALKQDNLKKMLAFSSIGQMGLVLVAFSLGSQEGSFAAIFQMFNHAIIKPMLFFAAGYLLFSSSNYKLDDLNGLAKKKPFTAFIFSLGALAIIGLPPFAGFWSKLYILTSLAKADKIAIVALILVAAIIEAIYYLRIIGRLYFPKENNLSTIETRKTTFCAAFVMTLLALVILVIGVYPDLITPYIEAASSALVDKATYIQAVMK